jgi:cytochrome c-type biogenesis protein CcmH
LIGLKGILQSMVYKIIFVFSALLLCAIQVAAAAGNSSPEEIQAEVDRISSSIMSPFCPGRLLRDCPSGSAAELKEKIREKVRNGDSPSEIEESLIALYGQEVRAAPEAKGFGWAAWLVPIGFLLSGLLALAAWLVSKKAEEGPRPLATALDPEMKKRIDGALHSD